MATPEVTQPTPAPVLLGWGLTPPERLERAIRGRRLSSSSMYDLVVEVAAGISSRRGTETLEEMLSSLREPLRGLRRSYRSGRVLIDYEKGSELAYLLAYVPPYIRMAEQVIARSLVLDSIGPILDVGLVGAGPAPEAVALINLLIDAKAQVDRLRLHLFDIATDEWRIVREALLDVGCRCRWDGSIEVQHHSLDLRTPATFNAHRSILQSLDFVMVQNCLNEDIVHRPAAVENLLDLLSAMRPGSVLAIADQHNYVSVRDRIRMLADQVIDEVETLGRFDAAIRVRVTDPLPPVLTKHLLTGEDGLIPRKNLELGVLVLRVPASGPSRPVPEPDAAQEPDRSAAPKRPPGSTAGAPARARRVPTPAPRRLHSPERTLAGIRVMADARERAALKGERCVLDELRRARKAVAGVVTRAETGGVFVDIAGVEVFIPADRLELDGPRGSLRSYVGQRLAVLLEDVGAQHARGNRRALLARRRLQLLAGVEVGDRLTGHVRVVQDGHVILDVDGLEAVVPVRELSHDWVDHPSDLIAMGDEHEVEVIEVDRGQGRVLASLARCTPDLIADFAESHDRGQLVLGEVSGLEDRWADVRIGDLPARIHISQIAHGWITHPSAVLQDGQEVWAAFVGVHHGKRERHIRLSLTEVHAASPVAPDFADLWEEAR